MRLCIFGGQYGSEGKGSASEYIAKYGLRKGKRLVAIGENSPNSGHTCSLGKTRQVPAVSYFADAVILGPDSAVDPEILISDLSQIAAARGGFIPRVYIHEHAALIRPIDQSLEESAGLKSRISSTGSGSGAARVFHKGYLRETDAVVKSLKFSDAHDICIINRSQYMDLMRQIVRDEDDVIMECSQGALLDINWGIYPYVTSRSTMPRVAVERNALHSLGLNYVGVYRTFPIRTGGPSGPTGGAEISFDSLGVSQEIATVTKRIRRIFQFDAADFKLSIDLNRPYVVAFTHLDYLGIDPNDIEKFLSWYKSVTNGGIGYYVDGLILSSKTGQFVNHLGQQL